MEKNAQKPTILLVEDSEEDVFFFMRALEKSGVAIKTLVAVDGREAIKILENKETRSNLLMVFLDLKMPMLNGFEVLRWVQNQKLQPPLRIVVLTGSAQERDRTLAEELGALDYLVKPVSREMVEKHLTAALDSVQKRA